MLEKLGDTEEEWQRITDSNVRVRTTLSRLGPDAAARLIYHGYVLAMANLHTILDSPLLDVPDRSRFVALLN